MFKIITVTNKYDGDDLNSMGFFVVVVFFFFFFCRAIRNPLPKFQREQRNKDSSSSKVSNIIYTGDDCAYEEVGEVTKNSDYDELN